MLALGSKWRCWVVHAGIGFEMSVLVIHTGVRLKMSVLVRRHWRWVVHVPFLGSRRRCWSYTLVFGPKCWCWFVDVGIGSYTLALGCTRAGIGFETSVLVLHTGVQLKTSVLVRRRWRWVVHTGIGSYALALGPTQWHWAVHAGIFFMAHEVMDNGGKKGLETHHTVRLFTHLVGLRLHMSPLASFYAGKM